MKKHLIVFLAILSISSYAEAQVMPLVTVDQAHHQVLRDKAQAVAFPLNAQARATITDLKDTFKSLESPFGKPAGLAAPQIGISLRIIIIQIPPEAKYKRIEVYNTLPPTVYIDPAYTPITQQGKYKDWEGCYSVPDQMGEVMRYQAIHFTAYTEEGKKVDLIAHGFLARLLQHETDHLNGKIYIDYHCKGCRSGEESDMLKIRQQEQTAKQKKQEG